MKRQLIFVFALVVSLIGSLGIAVAAKTASKTATLSKTEIMKNKDNKLSYAMGLDAGMNFQQLGIPVKPEVFVIGLQHGLSKDSKGAYMQREDINTVLTEFQKSWQAKQEVAFKKVSEENAKAGEKFLASNKSKPGVKTLKSGLQYKVITPGKGNKPKATDKVTVDYQGRLINGTEFDSSYKIGKPVTFKVSEVIPGWTEVLQLMSTGSTWEVYIPAKLAYGERGVGGPIGPNQTLIFKIHLISIGDRADSKKSS